MAYLRPDPQVRIDHRCPTECSYDDGMVEFCVRCKLEAGHTGRHRGVADVYFAPLFTVDADDQAAEGGR